MRCRSVGSAIAATSASVGVERPWISALALAAASNVCEARGPAPHSTYFFVTSGTLGSLGRVALDNATQYATTEGAAGAARTNCCMLKISDRSNTASGMDNV